jgi:prophage antirepressor-like protein
MSILPFNFKNNTVRVVTGDNGEFWFLAKDVAEILGYSDTEAMTRKLDAEEVQNRQIVGFGNRGVNLINESGLYSAILTSQKPEAKIFKKWVTSEVLPSIRKT